MGIVNNLKQIKQQIEEKQEENKKIDEKIDRIKTVSVKIGKIKNEINIMKKVIKAKGESEFDWSGYNCYHHKDYIVCGMVNVYKEYAQNIDVLLEELADERRKLEKLKMENNFAMFQLNNKAD